MSMLRQQLSDLASAFASNVLDAIRSASLEELLAESSSIPPRGAARLGRGGNEAGIDGMAVTGGGAAGASKTRSIGRLARRSSEDIEQVIGRIVGLLKQHPKGLRAEEIRNNLGLLSKEMPRPLKEGLESGRLGKSGRKRATTYFVKSSGVAFPKGAGRGAPHGRASKGADASGGGERRSGGRRAGRPRRTSRTKLKSS